MAEENKELSVDFYNYVCNIIGTEKIVKKRREIFTSLDCVVSNNVHLQISSGSKAEGLDLKGSDVDLMFYYMKMIARYPLQKDLCKI